MARMLTAGCERASAPGWPCDPEMEKLREQFAREADPVKQKQIAESISGARHASDDPCRPRPVVYGRRCSQQRERDADRTGAGILECREDQFVLIDRA